MKSDEALNSGVRLGKIPSWMATTSVEWTVKGLFLTPTKPLPYDTNIHVTVGPV